MSYNQIYQLSNHMKVEEAFRFTYKLTNLTLQVSLPFFTALFKQVL